MSDHTHDYTTDWGRCVICGELSPTHQKWCANQIVGREGYEREDGKPAAPADVAGLIEQLRIAADFYRDATMTEAADAIVEKTDLIRSLTEAGVRMQQERDQARADLERTRAALAKIITEEDAMARSNYEDRQAAKRYMAAIAAAREWLAAPQEKP